jgi:RimJ/RimL family protein N-acetyltransferase
MEGLIGALSLGFKSDEIRKISFYVASSNIPMKKVLSKLEFFRREGLLRCKMTDADLEIYSIFREEYEELLQRKTVRRILSNLKFEV